mmetsp:Transcript_59838/g.118606  ORF Transcript_59838/g.118606 Transcript_59838/m.118606 type:complete len:204 (+) Transcript_59838:1228-1839(+)
MAGDRCRCPLPRDGKTCGCPASLWLGILALPAFSTTPAPVRPWAEGARRGGEGFASADACCRCRATGLASRTTLPSAAAPGPLLPWPLRGVCLPAVLEVGRVGDLLTSLVAVLGVLLNPLAWLAVEPGGLKDGAGAGREPGETSGVCPDEKLLGRLSSSPAVASGPADTPGHGSGRTRPLVESFSAGFASSTVASTPSPSGSM